MEGNITCEMPNNNIHKYEGNMTLKTAGEEHKIPLSADNIILRGCSIKNSEFAEGIVVFAGHDTKIMQNSAKSVYKMSDLELKTNIAIVVILSLQFVLATTASIFGTLMEKNLVTNFTYLYYKGRPEDH